MSPDRRIRKVEHRATTHSSFRTQLGRQDPKDRALDGRTRIGHLAQPTGWPSPAEECALPDPPRTGNPAGNTSPGVERQVVSCGVALHQKYHRILIRPELHPRGSDPVHHPEYDHDQHHGRGRDPGHQPSTPAAKGANTRQIGQIGHDRDDRKDPAHEPRVRPSWSRALAPVPEPTERSETAESWEPGKARDSRASGSSPARTACSASAQAPQCATCFNKAGSDGTVTRGHGRQSLGRRAHRAGESARFRPGSETARSTVVPPWSRPRSLPCSRCRRNPFAAPFPGYRLFCCLFVFQVTRHTTANQGRHRRPAAPVSPKRPPAGRRRIRLLSGDTRKRRVPAGLARGRNASGIATPERSARMRTLEAHSPQGHGSVSAGELPEK